MVEHVSIDRTVSDRNHWAFPIFEQFRKKYSKSKKGIAGIFDAEFRKGDK
jgi:hypothetical protein